MECWTWGDGLVYYICSLVAMCWYLSLIEIIYVLAKVPYFLLLYLPINLVYEFKALSLNRRFSNRTYSTLFEYGAIVYVRWILSTYRTNIVRRVFFGELHARALFIFRKIKYGTENIGDFTYESSVSDATPSGYWVYSKSRKHLKHDLVIYFVPGNMAGAASPYIYLEYLCILLVELQVQGFQNPTVFCIDIDYSDCGTNEHKFASLIDTVSDGWRYVSDLYSSSTSLFMGSGIGGTLMLSLLLKLARPVVEEMEPNSPCENKIPLHPTDSSSRNVSRIYEAGDEPEDVNSPNNGEQENPLISCISASNYSHRCDSHGALCTSDSRRPNAFLLISPLGRAAVERTEIHPDFLTKKCLAQLSRNIVSEAELGSMWTMPNCVRDTEWWTDAVPPRGGVLMYGSNEILTREIRQLESNLRSLENVKIVADCRDDEIHAWPIVKTFLARSATDKLDGVTQVANLVAKMLVMDCLCASTSSL